MKSRQYCSVCKQWLDMEVVPTGDGDDDGVIWFRCPQCQGFLPKLNQPVAGGDESQATLGGDPAAGAGARDRVAVLPGDSDDDGPDKAGDDADDDLARGADDVADPDDEDGDEDRDEDRGDDRDDDRDDDDEGPTIGAAASGATVGGEPVLEYAAMLAAVDPETAVPYRPWETYEVGQCVLHLAWNDCGVVVAKEVLPGGRRVVKCWFQGAGVVRLIENAPR